MMRVLTVRQPWAWAIVHGGKDIENRTRNLAGSYRGPVAIHAGKSLDAPAWGTPIIGLGWRRALRASTTIDELRRFCDHATTFGAVIGVVDLTDVHRGWSDMAPNGSGPDCCHSPWAELADTVEEDEGRGVVHLVLANSRPLRVPVPAVGRLGLWTADPELEAAIASQLDR